MGVGLIVMGAVALIAGVLLPRTIGAGALRNRPGEVICIVLGPVLVVGGLVLVALGR